MEKEQKIEEMAKVIHRNSDCNLDYSRLIALALYNNHYRKQSEPSSCSHENGGGWISVEERLPEESGWYLVNIIAIFDLEFTSLSHYSKGYGWENHDTVTHWMPLPEAPKMKGGAE